MSTNTSEVPNNSLVGGGANQFSASGGVTFGDWNIGFSDGTIQVKHKNEPVTKKSVEEDLKNYDIFLDYKKYIPYAIGFIIFYFLFLRGR